MAESLFPAPMHYVYWLGGSPCSGKSSISDILCDQYDLTVYHVDDAFESHAQRLTPEHHPCLCHWQSMTWEERWMRPADELLKEVIGCYGEHFSLVFEDLSAISDGGLMLVEGCALLPDKVYPMLSSPLRGVWVVPTPDFQRERYSRRAFARDILASCSDSEKAFDNWMNRDAAFADWVLMRTRMLGLPAFSVDGSCTVAENAQRVASLFGFQP